MEAFREPAPSAHLLSGLIWLLVSATVLAGEPVVLVDGNAILAVDPASQRGAHVLKVDGIDQLKQQWFWYRLGNAGPEQSLDTLPLVSQTLQGLNQLTLVYQTNQFRLTLTYRLNGSTPGLGVSQVSLSELVTVQNLGPSPLSLRLFWYSDFDLAGQPDDDVASGGGNVVIQSSPLVDPGRQSVAGRIPQHWQIGLRTSLLELLNDAHPTVLSDSASPVGPGDVAVAFEWGVVLATAGQGSAAAIPISTILAAPCQNTAPTLDPVADVMLDGTGPPLSIPLTGITSGSLTETQVLLVTATCSQPELVADPVVIHDLRSPTGALVLAPRLNTNGSATITVTVDDLGCTNNLTTRAFTVTVRQINQPPVVNIISPLDGATFLAPAHFTVLAEASDPDGFVTNVQFFAETGALGEKTEPPYFVIWSNVPVGTYHLTARATDNLGAAATSAVVRVTVVPNPDPVIELIGPLVLNRQTGLFEQVVRVGNPSPAPLAGVHLTTTQALPAGVRWWNAAGAEEGRPFVQHQLSVPAGGQVNFHLEFYLTNRLMVVQLTNQTGVFNPGYVALRVAPAPPADPVGTVLRLDRPARLLSNGHFLVEFRSLSNRFYYVQYTDQLTNAAWRTALPALPGNGSRVQWIDAGPPKTVSPPSAAPRRFYRVLLLP